MGSYLAKQKEQREQRQKEESFYALCCKKIDMYNTMTDIEECKAFINSLGPNLEKDIKKYFLASYHAGNFHLTQTISSKFPDRCVIIAYEEIWKELYTNQPDVKSPYYAGKDKYLRVLIEKLEPWASQELIREILNLR